MDYSEFYHDEPIPLSILLECIFTSIYDEYCVKRPLRKALQLLVENYPSREMHREMLNAVNDIFCSTYIYPTYKILLPNPFKRVLIGKSTYLRNVRNTCCICRGDHFKKCLQLPCNHTFHENCILGWLRLQNSCPMCRTKIS